MKRFNSVFLYVLLTGFLFGCSTNSNQDSGESGQQETVKKEPADQKGFSLTRNGITLIPVEDSPEYPDARLSLKTPDLSNALNFGTHQFSFNVENYKLGVQTKDASTKMCANSDQGQHIHFILNNAPYSAHYEPDFKKDLPQGHHVLLAFLSRSYHESLKTKGAYILKEFDVGSGSYDDAFDQNAPHMFYSRPKGTYVGKENIEKLLLDFFLVNVDLSPDGYKVKATINGTEFLLTRWVPYLIQGLNEGTVSLILELVDKDGNPVASPFNPVKREVTLAESEPLPPK